MESRIREYYIPYNERKRRYGNNHYKCATGDVEKGVALESLADGYRGTEQLKS
jgi:hypothetical protein